MNRYNNAQLRTLVRENRCYKDLICLETDADKICKVVNVADGALLECLSSNDICGFKISFGQSMSICSCPIRQYIAYQLSSETETKELEVLE